jgi:NAD(P)-dependent dehydrogenase (short-subunit alcohol dehydrogenase family)
LIGTAPGGEPVVVGDEQPGGGVEELDGKVAVITGGARGIGAAMATRFAAEGMRLVLADVDPAALDRAVAERRAAGAAVIGVPTDVSDAAALDALAGAARERFGTTHVICNNAGVSGHGRASWDQPEQEWQWVIGVNLLGVVNGIRSFVPTLVAQDEGHVVNTASLAGFVAAPYVSPYAATKHAVVAISTSLSLELRFMGSQVGVSVLCPGFLRTDIMDTDRAWPDALGASPGHADDDGAQFMIREVFQSAVDQGGDPAELADLVVDGIRTNRFVVTTHPEECARAVQNTGRTVDGSLPEVLEL